MCLSLSPYKFDWLPCWTEIERIGLILERLGGNFHALAARFLGRGAKTQKIPIKSKICRFNGILTHFVPLPWVFCWSKCRRTMHAMYPQWACSLLTSLRTRTAIGGDFIESIHRPRSDFSLCFYWRSFWQNSHFASSWTLFAAVRRCCCGCFPRVG